jgi:hypothetical protein
MASGWRASLSRRSFSEGGRARRCARGKICGRDALPRVHRNRANAEGELALVRAVVPVETAKVTSCQGLIGILGMREIGMTGRQGIRRGREGHALAAMISCILFVFRCFQSH